ncbi:Nitronate monooxygenase [Sphingobacterium spiritivorum]|uniref:Propionate 3-nitronate monooxygenase n=1 Tax=Sphingobacterium spiritivorum TaxID=258 RepID=A0A380CRK0_SPHSI|nr:nitronate monooxygenase [Sphingobacterium spiritivorum]SUJ27360.1 Nitronate monooxygenase [Sphingobacterium spiritivorum]
MHIKWKNEITEQLGITYPIIQAPMLGVTSPEMVAAASAAGCLGSLALGDLTAEQCTAAIRQTKALTSKPFAVNFFAHSIPPVTDQLISKYNTVRSFVQDLAEKHKLKAELPNLEQLQLHSYHKQVAAILEEKCPIVSFTFGNPDETVISLFKQNGSILIGTCTNLDEALALERSGIDIICVQGIEAGGHRGSFIGDSLPLVGGFSLLSQVLEHVRVPVIYAGGIYNAGSLRAVRTLGACGFQVGSLLLTAKESILKPFEKERLQQLKSNDVVLTNSFTGRYARGIRNLFSRETEASGNILPYPYQNKLTAPLRLASKTDQNPDFVSIWVGQSPYPFSTTSTTEILHNLIHEVESQDV